MKRTITTLALLAIGFAAGSVSPSFASDPAQGIVNELKAIKGELSQIRRVLEKGKP